MRPRGTLHLEARLVSTMRVFQNLEVAGDLPDLTRLVNAIEGKLSNGWTRDLQREQEVKAYGPSYPSYCFFCDARAQRPAAHLWLFLRRDKRCLKVGNIVPTAQSELSYDEYNLVLNEFFRFFVEREVDRLQLKASLSKADVTLEDFASPRTAALLRTFSRTANRSTGSSHPSDKEQWEEFVISAHLLNDQIYTDILKRWFVEEEHWPSDEAVDLTIEYEQGRSLLKRYDSESASR